MSTKFHWRHNMYFAKKHKIHNKRLKNITFNAQFVHNGHKCLPILSKFGQLTYMYARSVKIVLFFNVHSMKISTASEIIAQTCLHCLHLFPTLIYTP